MNMRSPPHTSATHDPSPDYTQRGTCTVFHTRQCNWTATAHPSIRPNWGGP